MRIFAPEQIKIRQKKLSDTPNSSITGVIYGKENDLQNLYYNDFDGNERILTYEGDWQITGIYNYFLKGVNTEQYGEEAVGNVVLGEGNQLNLDTNNNSEITQPLTSGGDIDAPSIISQSNLKYNFLKGSGNIIVNSSYSTIGGQNNILAGTNNLIDASEEAIISGASNLSSIIGSREVKTLNGLFTTVCGINGNIFPPSGSYPEFNQNNTTYLQFLNLQPISETTSQNILGAPPELGTLRLHEYNENDTLKHDLEIYKNGTWETVGTPSVSGNVVGTLEQQTLENKSIDFDKNIINNLNFSDISVNEEELTNTGSTITPTKNFVKVQIPALEGKSDVAIPAIDGSNFSDGAFLFIRFVINTTMRAIFDQPNIQFSAPFYFANEREINNQEIFIFQFDSNSGDFFEIANYRGQPQEVVENLIVNQIASFEKQDRSSNTFIDVSSAKKITGITKSYVEYSGLQTSASGNAFALIDDKNFKKGGLLTIRFKSNPALVKHDFSGTSQNRIFLHEHSDTVFYAQDQLVLQYDGNDFLEIGRKKDKPVHNQATSAYTTNNEQLVLAESGQTINISQIDANIKGNEIKIKDKNGNASNNNPILINNNIGAIDNTNNSTLPDYTIESPYGGVILKADDEGNLWTF